MTRSTTILIAITFSAAGLGAIGQIFLVHHQRQAARAWLHENGYDFADVMKLYPPDRILQFDIGSKSLNERVRALREAVCGYAVPRC